MEDYLVDMALGLLVLLMMINFRGVRSTARIFAWPTYMFIASIALLIGVGLYKYHTGHLEPFVYTQEHLKYMHGSMGVLTLTLVLRAFSSGSAALTGIESYANGVSSFKAPMMKKALIGLMLMTIFSMIMFAGVTFIATQTKIFPNLGTKKFFINLM